MSSTEISDPAQWMGNKSLNYMWFYGLVNTLGFDYNWKKAISGGKNYVPENRKLELGQTLTVSPKQRVKQSLI